MTAGPQIDFYVLQEQSPGGRFKLACRIVEKAYRLGHRVYVRTGNSDDTNVLDDLLWTFSQNSFVPHQLSTESGSLDSPVVIGEHAPAAEDTDVVISVADDPVSDFTAYPRIVEIVGCENAEKASGRNRFRYYREHGVEPNTHRIAP
jgi:DNA polymerase-3 subunit chi